MFLLLIFLILFSCLNNSWVYAQKEFYYFSFAKNKDRYFIGLEGFFYDKNNNPLNLSELNYEWIIFIDSLPKEYKTYKPFLTFTSEKTPSSGKVKIYSNDLTFNKEYSFVFRYRINPLVSIVRYIEELNVVLPFEKLNKNERLFPLTFNFSSINLSIAWKVLGNFYYSLLFDPENLPKDTEVKAVVTNIDDPSEFSSHSIKIK